MAPLGPPAATPLPPTQNRTRLFGEICPQLSILTDSYFCGEGM